jgi:carnitine O-acetyltransferase
LIKDHDLQVLSFQAFGSEYIKLRNYSPDAFVQTAIQIALYRLFGHQVGTYEATQMRLFLHGRTETTRGVSLESADFVYAMGPWPSFNPQQLTATELYEKKRQLMKAAIDAHVKYIKSASTGHGVDRHFLGLRMLCGTNEEELPALFKDPVFIRSKTWRASTSHLTHPRFENWYASYFRIMLSYRIDLLISFVYHDTVASVRLCRMVLASVME